MKKALYFSLILLTLAACKKKDKEDEESDAHAVLTPQENDTIHGGIMFPIDGSITSNIPLQGYTIRVFNETGDSVLHEQSVTEQNTSYTVHQEVNHALDTFSHLKMKLTLRSVDGAEAFYEYPFFYEH